MHQRLGASRFIDESSKFCRNRVDNKRARSECNMLNRRELWLGEEYITLFELLGCAICKEYLVMGEDMAINTIRTFSTSSPLRATIVGVPPGSSASASAALVVSSSVFGTANSSSQVHFPQRLSRHGTQHLAESGDEGVV